MSETSESTVYVLTHVVTTIGHGEAWVYVALSTNGWDPRTLPVFRTKEEAEAYRVRHGIGGEVTELKFYSEES